MTTEAAYCPFCEGACRFVYNMHEYRIYKCLRCGTGRVSPMPEAGFLTGYYSGFLFAANKENYQPVLASAKKLYPLLGLSPGGNASLLDIGGGGGFYAKAFEELGYGRSTYVDLDNRACDFARNIGLSTVLHEDAASLRYSGKKYDLILCRHLIEHLPNPALFIMEILKALSKKGRLLLMCPNGNSLEYLAYPRSNITLRIDTIGQSSRMAKSKVIQRFLCGDILHGIDPPRHLWAITQKGIQSLIDGTLYKATVTTHPLTDMIYSPYYRPGSLGGRAYDLCGTYFFAKIHGGTHLVSVIEKKQCPSQ